MFVPGKSVGRQMVFGTRLPLEIRLQSLEGSVSQSVVQIDQGKGNADGLLFSFNHGH